MWPHRLQAAHQAPPSLGFTRQEHWSGLPFPSPMHESEKSKWIHSALSDSSRPHGLQPTRLLCPWDFPGKSTGVGCHCLLQWQSLEKWLSISSANEGRRLHHPALFPVLHWISVLPMERYSWEQRWESCVGYYLVITNVISCHLFKGLLGTSLLIYFCQRSKFFLCWIKNKH